MISSPKFGFSQRPVAGIALLAGVAVVGGLLAGCASVVGNIDGSRGNQIVEMALTQNPDRLRAQASEGSGKAQLALAFVLQYGLNGSDRNGAEADSLKRNATAPSGEILNGGVAIGSSYRVNPIEAESAEACLSWLTEPRELNPDDTDFVCGGEAGRAKFQAMLK